MVELLAAEAERMTARDGLTRRPACACGSPAVPGIEHGPASCLPAVKVG